MTNILTSLLPTIGTALLGPLGGIAAKFVTDKLGISETTVENVKNILTGMSPEKLLELQVADKELEVKLAQMGYDSLAKIEECNLKALEAVNNTMQAESKSEHWPQYTWRPFIGANFGFYIASLWILPAFGRTPVTLSLDMIALIGAILGIASWHRGQEKLRDKG